MKFNFLKSIYSILAGLAFCTTVFIVSSCNKDTEDDTESVKSLDGFWIATETVTDDCSGTTSTETKTEILSIIRNGNELAITVYPIAHEMSGTLTDNQLTWSGTIPTTSGNTALDFSGTLSEDWNEASGSASWTWSSETYQCAGTTQVHAEKVVVDTVDFSGDWQGTWQSEENSINGTFSVRVVQNNEILSGTIDVPEIGLSNAELTGQVSGNVVFFGDIEGTIKFVGLLNNNSGSGDYVYPGLQDEGTWTGTKQ